MCLSRRAGVLHPLFATSYTPLAGTANIFFHVNGKKIFALARLKYLNSYPFEGTGSGNPLPSSFIFLIKISLLSSKSGLKLSWIQAIFLFNRAETNPSSPRPSKVIKICAECAIKISLLLEIRSMLKR